MRKLEGFVCTNMVGSKIKFQFEVEDDDTEEQIEEYLQELAGNYYEIGYKEITA